MKMNPLTEVEQVIVLYALETILEGVSSEHNEEQAAALRQACEEAGQDVSETLKKLVKSLQSGGRLLLLDPEGEEMLGPPVIKSIGELPKKFWRDN